MDRPDLNEIPIPDLDALALGGIYVSCFPGMWDEMLQRAYDDGITILEMDGEEVVKAFRKQ